MVEKKLSADTLKSTSERFELITRNLQEVISEDELKEVLKKKEVSLYWGTMPTGSVSFAYFFPMLKIADFLKAGIKVKILLADLHAALDGVPWEVLDKRYNYYKRAIILILKRIGVDISKLEFIKGSEIQLNEKYFNDLLKLSVLTSVRDSTKAACEAVKTAKGDNVKLSGMIYPLMQALDEEYLNVDIQFAGLDQRKIMVYAREFLPKIGYKSRVELMTPMIRGLVGEQMSSSVASSKIDLIDDEETIIKKIKKADCVEGDSKNGLMAIMKYLVFVLKGDKGEKVIIERSEKFGGNIEYSNYEDLEKDFINKNLHPLDLKNMVSKEVNSMLDVFRKDKELHKLYKEAYE